MLSVADNGVGCADIQREGLGSRWMHPLAQQLNTSISWKTREVGCEVCPPRPGGTRGMRLEASCPALSSPRASPDPRRLGPACA